MKDKRVMVFRQSLEELVESLEATLRVAGWGEAESVPEPLRDSAAKLMSRLGTADRLATGIFKGTATDMARVSSMTEAMRKLEVAYVAYRKKLDAPESERGKAADDLIIVIERVKSQSFGPS